MSKVILVMDVPTSCRKCMCYVIGESNNFCSATKFAIFNGATIPHHCPLKWIPDKRDENGIWILDGYIDDRYSQGWNDCIDEILGGES